MVKVENLQTSFYYILSALGHLVKVVYNLTVVMVMSLKMENVKVISYSLENERKFHFTKRKKMMYTY